MIQDVVVMCNKVGHDSKPVEGICTFKDCKEQRTCCVNCIFNIHSAHFNYVQPLPGLKDKYSKQLGIVNQLHKLLQTVTQVIAEIEKAFTAQYPIYPQQPDLIALNLFAQNLAAMDVNQENKLKDSLAQSTQIIEQSLNGVFNSIKGEDKIQLQKRKAEAENLRKKGVELREQEKYEEAIKLYNQSIEIYDQDDDCWKQKGYALHMLGKYVEAIECHDQAILIQPKKALYYSRKASSLIRLKRYDEALTQVNKAIELDPNHGDSWNNKGFALNELNRKQEALECYKKAVEINPKNHIYLGNVAATLENLGQKQEALKYYRDALKYNPTYEISLDGLKRLENRGCSQQ